MSFLADHDVGMSNVSRQMLDYFKTGSIATDMVLAVLVTKIVMIMFNMDLLIKLFHYIKKRATKTNRLQTIIKYNPCETLNNVREGSLSAYNIFHEFFCDKTQDMALENGRMIMTHRNNEDIVHRWNIDKSVKQVLPLQKFRYKNMDIQFYEHTPSNDPEDENRGKDRRQDMKKSNYIIAIEHKTKEDLDLLFKEVVEYSKKKYIKEKGHIRFQYFIFSPTNGHYQLFNSPVQKVSLQSITLPEAQKAQLSKTLRDFKHQRGYYDPCHGNPYRLVFLIHGPPGNGKTSFTKMLINYFKIENVKVIPSLSIFEKDENMRETFFGYDCGKLKDLESDSDSESDEKVLESEFVSDKTKTKRPNLQMMVFEEIDAGDKFKVLQNRKIKKKKKKEELTVLESVESSNIPEKEKSVLKENQKKCNLVSSSSSSNLTMAAWLDVFDGLMSLENKIVVITTNNINYLDPAIYRKRRVTMMIHFRSVEPDIFSNFLDQHFSRLEDEEKEMKGLEDQILLDPLQNRYMSEIQHYLSAYPEILSHAEMYDAYYLCNQDKEIFLSDILIQIRENILEKNLETPSDDMHVPWFNKNPASYLTLSDYKAYVISVCGIVKPVETSRVSDIFRDKAFTFADLHNLDSYFRRRQGEKKTLQNHHELIDFWMNDHVRVRRKRVRY